MRSFAALFVLFVLLVAPTVVRAGPLKDIEDSGSRPSRSSDDNSRSSSSSASSDDDDDDDDDEDDEHSDLEGALGYGLWQFTRYVVLMPWTLPNMLVDEPCLARYAYLPYADGRGNLRNNEARSGCSATAPAPAATRAVAGQVSLEGAYALAFSNVTAATVSARLQLPYRLELSGRLSVATDLDERPREQALMGTTHFSARFAQSAHVEVRTGLGVRAFGLNKPLAGFDFLYAIDAYGKRPVIASMEFHGGFLGQAGVLQARLSVGYLLKNVELYAGYDHTRIHGSAGTTRLSGPLLGIRAWF